MLRPASSSALLFSRAVAAGMNGGYTLGRYTLIEGYCKREKRVGGGRRGFLLICIVPLSLRDATP
jgi:hypothetical protein